MMNDEVQEPFYKAVQQLRPNKKVFDQGCLTDPNYSLSLKKKSGFWTDCCEIPF